MPTLMASASAALSTARQRPVGERLEREARAVTAAVAAAVATASAMFAMTATRA
jgi:hypothetical protein